MQSTNTQQRLVSHVAFNPGNKFQFVNQTQNVTGMADEYNNFSSEEEEEEEEEKESSPSIPNFATSSSLFRSEPHFTSLPEHSSSSYQNNANVLKNAPVRLNFGAFMVPKTAFLFPKFQKRKKAQRRLKEGRKHNEEDLASSTNPFIEEILQEADEAPSKHVVSAEEISRLNYFYATAGEDSLFVHPLAAGVLDGVGGWGALGIDSGLNSKTIAMLCLQQIVDQLETAPAQTSTSLENSENKKQSTSPGSPSNTIFEDINVKKILQIAYDEVQRAKIYGSTTASIVKLNPVCCNTSSSVSLSKQNRSSPMNVEEDAPSKSQKDPSNPNLASTEEIDSTSSTNTSTSLYSIDFINLGDSGFLIYRPSTDTVVYRTREQQHFFNAPYQMSVVPDLLKEQAFADSPDMADYGSVQHVQIGDIIVMGTDGLFDNLFDEEITDVWKELSRKRTRRIKKKMKQLKHKLADKLGSEQQFIQSDEFDVDLHEVAYHIAKRAFKKSKSIQKTPFEVNAQLNNFDFKGGKIDDISVIVCQISSNNTSIGATMSSQV